MKFFHKKEKQFTVYFTDRTKIKITLYQYNILTSMINSEKGAKDWQTFSNSDNFPVFSIKLSEITHIK